MSVNDWMNPIVAIGTVALAVVASLYVRLKAKIDTKTAASKTLTLLVNWPCGRSTKPNIAKMAGRLSASTLQS